MCPEHEHFQQRSGENPLLWAPPTAKHSSQPTFPEGSYCENGTGDELEVGEPDEERDADDDEAGSDTLVEAHAQPSRDDASRKISGREVLGEVQTNHSTRTEVKAADDAKASLIARATRGSTTKTTRV